MKKKLQRVDELPPAIDVLSDTQFVATLSGSTLTRVQFQFTPKTRAEVKRCCAHFNGTSRMQAFIAALEQELGPYDVLARQDRTRRKQKNVGKSKLTAEGAIRHALQKGEDQLQAAVDAIEKLLQDSETRLRLDAACQVGLTQEAVVAALNSPDYDGIVPGALPARANDARTALESFLEILRLARKIRGASPKGGRPTTPLPAALIRKIAGLVEKHFGVRPTTTRHGPFENLVTHCFQSVNWHVKDTHKLVAAALRNKKEHKPPTIGR